MKGHRPFLLREPNEGASEIAPTEDERAWWREASKPDRRRILLKWIPWYLGAIMLPAVVRDPGAFIAGKWKHIVPAAIAIALVTGFFMWKASSSRLLRTRLVGKRIRDALLESADRGE